MLANSPTIEKCVFIYTLSSEAVLKKPQQQHTRSVYSDNVNCIFCLFFQAKKRRARV